MLVGLVPQSAKADKLILMVVVKSSNTGLNVFIDAILMFKKHLCYPF